LRPRDFNFSEGTACRTDSTLAIANIHRQPTATGQPTRIWSMGTNRVLARLRQHGIASTLDRLVSVLQERLFDRRYGTDTVAFSDLDSLTIDGDNLAEAIRYEPMRLRVFQRAIAALQPPTSGTFVDIGCGKGRQLLLAAKYGFQRVTGIEFAEELCVIARDNAQRFKKATGLSCDVRIVNRDATEYEIQNDEDVFLVNNPFGEALVDKLMANIARSLKKKERPLFIIYNNPRFRATIERHGFVRILNIDGGDCVAYGSKSAEALKRRQRSGSAT
jgi:SAM-dependent methyltransferase